MSDKQKYVEVRVWPHLQKNPRVPEVYSMGNNIWAKSNKWTKVPIENVTEDCDYWIERKDRNYKKEAKERQEIINELFSSQGEWNFK